MGTAFYIQFPGLAGDIKTGDYKGWFTLLSLSLGTGREGLNGRGVGRDRENRPSLTDITFTMGSGAPTASILQAAAQGKTFPTAKIVMVAVDGDQQHAVLEIELTNVMVSSVVVHQGGDVSVSLVFDQVKQTARGGPPRVEVAPARRP